MYPISVDGIENWFHETKPLEIINWQSTDCKYKIFLPH